MAKVRTDKKGRKLDKGEYQNPDGRYVYHYTFSDFDVLTKVTS